MIPVEEPEIAARAAEIAIIKIVATILTHVMVWKDADNVVEPLVIVLAHAVKNYMKG